MKRALALFISLVLAACGSGGPSPSSPSSATPNAPAPTSPAAVQASKIAEQVGWMTIAVLQNGSSGLGIRRTSTPGRISPLATSGELFSSRNCEISGTVTVVYIRDSLPAGGAIDLSALKAVYSACTFMTAAGSVEVSGDLALQGQYLGVGKVTGLAMTGTLSSPTGGSCVVSGTVNALGGFSGTACGFSVTSVPPPLPTLPVLWPIPIFPSDGDAVPQNNASGCQPHPTRGLGNEVAFTWAPPNEGNPTAYHLYVIGRARTDIPNAPNQPQLGPLVDRVVTGTRFEFRSCNGFVGSNSLVGWTWRVRAQYADGTFGPWSRTVTFDFQQCVLSDGRLCTN